MKRDDLDAFLTELLAEHLVAMRAALIEHIDKAVASKPVPPFVPPQPWAEGKRYYTPCCVRHRGGLFYAQRDTEEEPPSDAWVPLVVGLSGIDMRWLEDGHTFQATALLSDGRVVEHQRTVAVPIVRGYWSAETTYMPGDRVFRYGEHQCLKMCMGYDPVSAEATDYWEKVGGKYARGLSFSVTDDGDITESGRVIGSMKPMVAKLLSDLTKRAA